VNALSIQSHPVVLDRPEVFLRVIKRIDKRIVVVF